MKGPQGADSWWIPKHYRILKLVLRRETFSNDKNIVFSLQKWSRDETRPDPSFLIDASRTRLNLTILENVRVHFVQKKYRVVIEGLVPTIHVGLYIQYFTRCASNQLLQTAI